VLNEQLENALTDALSELGKFDAEARENLRQFTQVIERANREAETTTLGRTTTAINRKAQPVDLQAMIDELRAEIALAGERNCNAIVAICMKK